MDHNKGVNPKIISPHQLPSNNDGPGKVTPFKEPPDPAATQALLKQFRGDRLKQIEEYQRREKEEQKQLKKAAGTTGAIPNPPTRIPKIRFISNIVLLEAAARNDLEEVQRLLDSGIDPNSCNEDGLTALHQCCIDHYPAMMKLLVEGGADVNATDSELWTPLHAAVTCNHLDLVQYLIANDADLLAVNSDGNIPYDICEETQTGDRILEFIQNAMANRGITQQTVDEAKALPQIKMLNDVKLSVANGFNINLPRETDQATVLHIASANGYIDVVSYLLEDVQDVDVHVKDKVGWQPIHAACCWCHMEIALLLVEHGASLETVTNNFETALDLCDDEEFKDRLIQKEELVKEQQKLLQEEAEKRAAAAAAALANNLKVNNSELNTPSQTGAATNGNNGGSFNGGSSMPFKKGPHRDSILNPNDPFKRQGSRRSFRSSVRRSSMREKKDLSRRDMKEEYNANAVSSGEDGNFVIGGDEMQNSPSSDQKTFLELENGMQIASESGTDPGIQAAPTSGNYPSSRTQIQYNDKSAATATPNNDFLPSSQLNNSTQHHSVPYSQNVPSTISNSNSSQKIVDTYNNKSHPQNQGVVNNSTGGVGAGSDPNAYSSYSQQQHINNNPRNAPGSYSQPPPPHQQFNNPQQISYNSNLANSHMYANESNNIAVQPQQPQTLSELKHRRAHERNQQQQHQMLATGGNSPDSRHRMPLTSNTAPMADKTSERLHKDPRISSQPSNLQTGARTGPPMLGGGSNPNHFNPNNTSNDRDNISKYPSTSPNAHQNAGLNRNSGPATGAYYSAMSNSLDSQYPRMMGGPNSGVDSDLGNKHLGSQQQLSTPMQNTNQISSQQSYNQAISSSSQMLSTADKNNKKKNKSCKVM